MTVYKSFIQKYARRGGPSIDGEGEISNYSNRSLFYALMKITCGTDAGGGEKKSNSMMSELNKLKNELEWVRRFEARVQLFGSSLDGKTKKGSNRNRAIS